MFSKYILIAFIAFVCESVDSSLGMGYGTILTPALLVMGFEPTEIVPLILLSEFITGITAARMHYKKGNVNFKKGSRELRVSLLLALFSIIGTVIAVLFSISIPKMFILGYIACLLLAVGFANLTTLNKKRTFSWRRITILGIVASFNKGISGGGYGPIVIGGQMLSGIKSKSAVGITSLTEGFTCLVGFIAYSLFNTGNLNWILGLALIGGAICSVPISVNFIKIIDENKFNHLISYSMFTLGTLTLAKTLNMLFSFDNLGLIFVTLLLITLPLTFKLKESKESNTVS